MSSKNKHEELAILFTGMGEFMNSWADTQQLDQFYNLFL